MTNKTFYEAIKETHNKALESIYEQVKTTAATEIWRAATAGESRAAIEVPGALDTVTVRKLRDRLRVDKEFTGFTIDSSISEKVFLFYW